MDTEHTRLFRKRDGRTQPSRANRRKLSWIDTAKAMSLAREDWSERDVTAGDGLHGV
jgi:hypothetical protein